LFSRKIKVDPELVRELSKLLDETGLSEIEIERGGTRVRVVRDAPGGGRTPVTQVTRAATAAGGEEAAAEDYAKHPGAVLSPMVGTAYRANEPGGKPLCEVGDEVNAGQPLLIVEAMKTMNAIPAPRPGKVAKILFEDAQPVEFGEALVILE
jgi:acetyl-CoA carboxylase biotin carboxyl carrier protein